MPRNGHSAHSTKPKAHRARSFTVKFERGVWFVQQGKTWRKASELMIVAGVITRPDGVLVGQGVVQRTSRTTFSVLA